MRRRKVADWSAGALGVILLALGGLVVVKPAVDHWDSLYRADPFAVEKASVVERVLGNSGLLALRLILVALAAFLVAAILRRVILGDYGPRIGRTQAAGLSAVSERTRDEELPTKRDSLVTPAAVINAPTTGEEPPGTNLASPIATLISSRREELGLSQRELAKRAGISHTLVSRVEQGEHTPSRKTLERLADVLGAGRT